MRDVKIQRCALLTTTVVVVAVVYLLLLIVHDRFSYRLGWNREQDVHT